MKAVNKLYGKKTRKEDRRPIYLLYLDFISAFNNHSLGDEIIPESNALVAFGQICSLFGVFRCSYKVH